MVTDEIGLKMKNLVQNEFEIRKDVGDYIPQNCSKQGLEEKGAAV